MKRTKYLLLAATAIVVLMATVQTRKIIVIKAKKECIYSVGDSGTLTGGAMATIDLAGTLTRVGGVECPPTEAGALGSPSRRDSGRLQPTAGVAVGSASAASATAGGTPATS
jgi:hypothetical protein